MNAKTLWTGLIVVATALLIVLGLLTRPHQSPQTAKTPKTPKITSNPLEVPLVEHMIEDGLDVGAEPGHQLVVGRVGDEVSLTLSSELLEFLGPGSLEQLELSTTQTQVSWSRYEKFLEDLHDLIVARHPEVHEHDHDHEHGHPHERHGHDHEHDLGHEKETSPEATSAH